MTATLTLTGTSPRRRLVQRLPPPALDSVVVNYRTPWDLDTFLASYAAYPCERPGLLTVANVEPGPADLEVAAKWQRCMDLDHLRFDTNVGYARACNRGALAGVGDVLALFNADVVLSAGALTDCYSALVNNPRWGVLGPRQVDAKGHLVAPGVFGEPEAPQFGAPFMSHDRGQCSGVRDDALSVSGSAYFVRRSLWGQLTACPLYQKAAPDAEGAFLPTPHYYEEMFCSLHARHHGATVVFWGPTAIVHLFHRASPMTGPARADRHMPESLALFRAACDLHGIRRE